MLMHVLLCCKCPSMWRHVRIIPGFYPTLDHQGQDLKAEDQALLYEALSSQAVFTPKAFEEQQAAAS